MFPPPPRINSSLNWMRITYYCDGESVVHSAAYGGYHCSATPGTAGYYTWGEAVDDVTGSELASFVASEAKNEERSEELVH